VKRLSRTERSSSAAARLGVEEIVPMPAPWPPKHAAASGQPNEQIYRRIQGATRKAPTTFGPVT